MRKLVLVAMSTAVMLSFAACSKDNNDANVTPEPTPVEDQIDGGEVTPEVTPEGEDQTDASNEEEMAKLQSYRDAVAETLGEDYIPSMQYSADEMSELFGLTPDMYDAAFAEGPMMSVHVDTFIAVHPAEGQTDAVVNALTTYMDAKKASIREYPMNLLKIQGSRVETIGDYVFYFLLGSVDDVEREEEEVIAEYEVINQSAVDAIQAVMDNE